MRMLYVVTYDISGARRLRQVFKILRGYGDHLQLSVFSCELAARELAQLEAELEEVINNTADQVLFFPLGPASGRNHGRVKALGKPYTVTERGAKVV
ncbi:MAG: CRISPR-associated endonuclease Cas2 [Candidatus Krumholzibacteria bacterium]|nr:CRISPR-associated endonuclease Cas2 [Candidatus Krumholzibacteria bacterium]